MTAPSCAAKPCGRRGRRGTANQSEEPEAAWSRENELCMRSGLEKMACAKAHADLSCDELEVAPGAPLAPEGCVRLARPHAQGSECDASARWISAILHICIFSGADRRELHAALSGKGNEPTSHGPRRPLNEAGVAARHVVTVLAVLHVV